MPNIFEIGDAPSSIAGAQNLGLGLVLRGRISTNADVDFYKVQLVAGQTYTGALVGTGNNPLGDPFFKLYDSNGVLIAEVDDGLPNHDSFGNYTAAYTGAYYIGVQSFDNLFSGQYGVSVALGTKAVFDSDMAAGVINTRETWAAGPALGANVTFGFRSTGASYTVDGSDISTFTVLTAQEQVAARAAIALFAEAADITFTDVNPNGLTNNASILFGNYFDANDGAGAFAYYPGATTNADQSGDVWLNLDSVSSDNLPSGSYSFLTLVHEIGHAVGLSHPGDYNAAPNINITYADFAQFNADSAQYSVMSYFDAIETGANFPEQPVTLMVSDIEALHNIYGVNANTRAGNTVYGFNANAGATYDLSLNAPKALCIWDGGGSDTIDCSGFVTSQLINLEAGSFSDIGGLHSIWSIALRAQIENAIGGSDKDTLNGNALANDLNGGAGADIMRGGDGNDTYHVNVTTDSVIETNAVAATGGTDKVVFEGTTGTYVLTANVEDLELAGNSAIKGTGNALVNHITGNGAANTLNGGAGADVLTGGDGNDLYVVDNIGDMVVEIAGTVAGAADYIYSSISLTIKANVERLYLIGTAAIDATGLASQNDYLNGNSAANTLSGLDGKDVLNGGLGADNLIGGNGNDSYYVDNVSDIVTEAAGTVAGTLDYIYASVSFTNAANVERMYLTGTAAINATGLDGQGDILYGNSGENGLDGKNGSDLLIGGLGNDTLTGGLGRDSFRFDSALNALTNKDIITDYNVVDDTIQLENAIFTQLFATLGNPASTGILNAGLFGLAASSDADDRIIYNAATGEVSYDLNGNGVGGATVFAQLTANLALTNADFFVF